MKMGTELVLNLDDSKMKDAVQQAILAQLGDQARERIIGMAITHLTSAPRSTYGAEQKAPLQQAFERAVEAVARDLVNEWVTKSPEVKAAIEEKMKEVAARLLANDDGALSKVVAEAVAAQLVIQRRLD